MESKPVHIIDLGALETLFREHYHFLCSAAYQVTGENESARDIVQEFFYYCWNKRKELAITSDFKGYAFRAIRNASLNYIKSARKQVADPELTFEQLHSETAPTVEDLQLVTERDQALWAAIDKLPPQRKQIFLMSNRDDLTYAQIAEKLGVSVNTVKTQIRLAYQYLREECRWLIDLILTIIFLRNI